MKYKTHPRPLQSEIKHFAIISPNQTNSSRVVVLEDILLWSKKAQPSRFNCTRSISLPLRRVFTSSSRDSRAERKKIIYVIHVIVTLLSAEFFIVCGAASLGLLRLSRDKRLAERWLATGEGEHRLSAVRPIPFHSIHDRAYRSPEISYLRLKKY